MICMYVYIVCMATTYLKQSNMDQPHEVAKPAYGQLNGEIKCSCRCIRGKYICIAVSICLHTFFILGTCTFVHGSLLLNMNKCVTTAVSVHIRYYE